jgi:hypothetical protein
VGLWVSRDPTTTLPPNGLRVLEADFLNRNKVRIAPHTTGTAN